jgi:ribonuclease H / adenosylcobalamin/alpha-ribazole phosphatase
MSRWPSVLWIVRHGESAAMLANHAATSAGQHRVALNARDMDTGLSVTGAAQAHALGSWFATLDAHARPDVILTSPYQRATDTVAALRSAGGTTPSVRILTDERLRERELGILDGLTWEGVKALHPDQAQQRELLGKFYHRPPGGENWCDVILRLRGVIDRISLHHVGARVMIVAHECVIFCLRYVLEDLDEAAVLSIDAAGDIANCALTEYHAGAEGLILTRFNDTTPLTGTGATITAAREPIAAARG